jgi:hypothetical protein
MVAQMNNRDIEHIWKVASNNPNHDTNWHDPDVIAFANLVEAAARADEREACAKIAERDCPHCKDYKAMYIKVRDELVAEQQVTQRQTARIVDLQTHIENFDGEDR